MNIVWSKYIQGINTLYCTRKLRFHDMFQEQYKTIFALNSERPLKILEIGCGPGALAEALLRWYPDCEITAVDRDSEFINFAKKNISGINFVEGDATELPFANNTFDVTISNTVAEHIAPDKFYSEQMRVLKPNGVCLVLSARRGISASASCVLPNQMEEQFWKKAEAYDTATEQYAVCKYSMTEAEMPAAMEEYGFQAVSANYAIINLTPDNPSIAPELAYDMINALRECALDAIQSTVNTLPDCYTADEIEQMQKLVNEKYDLRLQQYTNHEKQWDTAVSVTMIVRGVKSQATSL